MGYAGHLRIAWGASMTVSSCVTTAGMVSVVQGLRFMKIQVPVPRIVMCLISVGMGSAIPVKPSRHVPRIVKTSLSVAMGIAITLMVRRIVTVVTQTVQVSSVLSVVMDTAREETGELHGMKTAFPVLRTATLPSSSIATAVTDSASPSMVRTTSTVLTVQINVLTVVIDEALATSVSRPILDDWRM